MKAEKAVQYLFYLLIVLLIAGSIGVDGGKLISPKITRIPIYIILALMVVFIIYYYLPKKRKQ